MASHGVGGQMATIGPWLTVDGPKVRTIKSAERTLALFEMFSLYQRPLGVGEISKALDAPQPSVSMLVRNLASLGYLEHDRAARTYVPTLRIMLLGSWIHRRFSQEHNLETRLDELVARLGETVVVGIQNGIHSQYVLAQLPEDPHRLEVQSGLLRPITCTAVGRVLLSLKPDAEIEAIVRRCNAEVEEDRLRVRPSAFMEMIEAIRAQGYARTGGDMTPGQAVIAISIPGPIGKMPMAVGVGGKIDRVAEKEDEILAALEEFRSASPAPPDP
jgi:IclR family KDG regulon transcriptional repressor